MAGRGADSNSQPAVDFLLPPLEALEFADVCVKFQCRLLCLLSAWDQQGKA